MTYLDCFSGNIIMVINQTISISMEVCKCEEKKYMHHTRLMVLVTIHTILIHLVCSLLVVVKTSGVWNEGSTDDLHVSNVQVRKK